MANGAAIDPASNLGGGTSILPGTSLTGTTPANGGWIDCKDLVGPVYGDFQVGAPTGTPTSFTVTGKLQEADTSGGSGSQDIVQQTDAIVLDASGEFGFVRGLRTKRYVRAVATPAFVSGTSPTAPVAASIRGKKERF